jgi:hypothetical protein
MTVLAIYLGVFVLVFTCGPAAVWLLIRRAIKNHKP